MGASGSATATARYEPIISFEALDDLQEAAIATEFANRLNSIIIAAADAKQTLTIFHWTHPEISRTRKFPAIAAALTDRTFDLHQAFASHYTSVAPCHSRTSRHIAGSSGRSTTLAASPP